MQHVTPFDVKAQQLSCGPGDSWCQQSLRSAYDDVLRSDSCALERRVADSDKFTSYYTWQPTYSSKPSLGSAFLNADGGTNRFGAKQVLQESFLQGRGQVSSNPGCDGSALRYLPETVFPGAPKKEWDMSLFSQQSIVPRSCASVTEVNLLQRMKPRPGSFEGTWRPFPAQPLPEGSRRIEEGITLANKRYPSYAELRARTAALLQ